MSGGAEPNRALVVVVVDVFDFVCFWVEDVRGENRILTVTPMKVHE